MHYGSKFSPFLRIPILKRWRSSFRKWQGEGKWRATSPKRVILRTTACVLCIAVGVGCYALYVKLDKANSSLSQIRRLDSAIARGDLHDEVEALRQLVEAMPSSNNRYRLALAEERFGLLEKATSEMLQLSYERVPEAALWIAEHDFEQSGFGEWDEPSRSRYRDLLQISILSKDVDVIVRSKNLFSAFLLETGDLQEAISQLTDLAAYDPDASLHLATLYRSQGEATAAIKFATQAQLHFEDCLQKRPADDGARIKLARSLLLLERERDALALLANGFEFTRQPKLQQASGEVLVVWAKRLEQKKDSLLARVQLIHRATQCAPSDHVVLAALLSLVKECVNHGEQCDEEFQLALASGSDRESLHFILGVLAIERRQLADARLHLDLAEQAGSLIPIALNNLALALLDSGEFHRALMYADIAVERLHEQPYFCETRGRILLRLGRFEESIVELEKGLGEEELKPLVYSGLAVAYRHVGNDTAAEAMEMKLESHHVVASTDARGSKRSSRLATTEPAVMLQKVSKEQ